MNSPAVASGYSKQLKKILRHWQLYLLILPPVVYVIMFRYVPILGSQIAFRDYKLNMGLFGSKWVGFKHFADFLTGNEEEGPFGRIAAQDEAEPGDVIQLADASGSYYHAMLIVGFSGGEPLVAAQSENSLDRPLSTYSYAFARFLHVEGVRADREETGACFDALYDGVALFPSS